MHAYPEVNAASSKAEEYHRLASQGMGYIGDTVKQPGAVQEAISRANGIANLLESTNGLLDNSLSRLTGGVPVPDMGRGGIGAPQASGDIGLLMAVLDRIYAQAELNSNYAGQVARL